MLKKNDRHSALPCGAWRLRTLPGNSGEQEGGANAKRKAKAVLWYGLCTWAFVAVAVLKTHGFAVFCGLQMDDGSFM